MPAKNVIKPYVEGGYYHLYNRGVEKRTIFEDNQDYQVFLSDLRDYLIPFVPTPEKPFPPSRLDLSEEIMLLAFCLMPNHFHLLVWQKTENAIEKLMRGLGTRYALYFNKRYERVGSLFQSNYKAVLIETDEQLLYLSRYIHLNPLKDGPLERSILLEAYSSYKAYLGEQELEWLHPEVILAFFETAQKASLKDMFSYQSFIEGYKREPEEGLERLILE